MTTQKFPSLPGIFKRVTQLLLLSSVILAGVIASLLLLPSIAVAKQNPRTGEYQPTSSQVTSTVFLPTLHSYKTPFIPGVQMNGQIAGTRLTRAVNARVHWVRFSAYPWDAIEPVRTSPPTYRWWVVDEDSLRNASANGMEVVAIVQFTPYWAQKYPGSYCGPIKENALDEFAQFLTALVSRYKQPPYNVRYWELGNEPDAPIWYNHSAFGCWGDQSDSFYGGRYYAQMLKLAYPAIKAADPQAQVLIGGLLLDHPTGGADNSPRFLEGILVGGGGSYFDIVSFHGYAQYSGYTQDWELNFPAWSSRGGVVAGKAQFIRETLSRYGYHKPLMHTEAALLCNEHEPYCNPPTSAFYQAQAAYVPRVYVRNTATDIMGTTWFTLDGPGWRNGGLLDASQNPRPAYDAYQFMTQELDGSACARLGSGYAGVTGYACSRPGKIVHVLWSPDKTPHTVTLPPNFNQAYNLYGNLITPLWNTIQVGFDPVYLELMP